jgi:transcriptional regulator with XRE-family HTH domain
MPLGEKVQRLREARGLTQQELATRARISQPVISLLESQTRHNVKSDVLKRLAQALGCTTDYLVGMYEEDEDSEFQPALTL